MIKKYKLHAACAAWLPMSLAARIELSDDIKLNGLHDPITLTPDGLLLDGRNRVEACEMAGVEIPPEKIEVYHGNPWVLSISRNARRRHSTPDQVAMAVAELARLARGGDRRSENFKGSNEPSIAEVAKAAGVPETAIKSAHAVRDYGTPEEI
jgi:ParB-like chromosome segregation protein Spo0J